MTFTIICLHVKKLYVCKMFWLNVLQTTGKSITPLYKKLVLKNVSALTLSMELSIVEPFSLCEAQGAQSSATTKVC